MNGRDDFMRLFLRHESDLKAFIGSLVLDRTLRDDVFQEVALALWKQADAFDVSRSFGAWTRGIASNIILQQRGKQARFPLTFSPETIKAIADAFERTETEAPRKAESLRECLKQLPEKSRQLLVLRYEEDLATTEIAARTRQTVDALYQALSRIRARLEDCIRQRLLREEATQ